MNKGALIYEDYIKLIEDKVVLINNHKPNQIQPSSIDLTLSSECYEIKASFLTPESKVRDDIEKLALNKINLENAHIFLKNKTYLVRLNERLDLNNELFGKCNPKSSTGRLDIFCRTVLDFSDEYEKIPKNYSGEMFLEITSRSFDMELTKNDSLNQMRLICKNHNYITDEELNESASSELPTQSDEEGDFDGSMQVNDQSNYTNVLPGVHFKYDLNDKTVLRLAWTNTLARPNYLDLVPYQAINNEDEEITLGNTDLNPTTSMNFDFMAEYYFGSVGLLSGGVFYKDINDFVYTYVVQDESTGYDIYQPLNGDNASIYGAEVSFQRQLNFLPGFAKNFSIYTNYTFLHSTANGIRNEDGDERGELDLPGSSPNMFNALSYFLNFSM